MRRIWERWPPFNRTAIGNKLKDYGEEMWSGNKLIVCKKEDMTEVHNFCHSEAGKGYVYFIYSEGLEKKLMEAVKEAVCQETAV